MKTILARVSLVVLVLFVLALIALALILVWPSLVFSQPIAVYPQLLKQIQAGENELAKLELKKKEIEEEVKMLKVCQKGEGQKDLKSFLLLFVEEFKNEILNDKVEVRLLKDKLMINVPAIFIDGIKVNKKGLLLLEKIGQSLSFLSGNRIEVIGHSLPLGEQQRKKFTSSWELSSLRAGLVARVFNWRAGIQGENIIPIGRSIFPIGFNENWNGIDLIVYSK